MGVFGGGGDGVGCGGVLDGGGEEGVDSGGCCGGSGAGRICNSLEFCLEKTRVTRVFEEVS